MKSCVFTISSKNHLHLSRTVLESVTTYSPDLDRILILCDEISEGELLDESFAVIPIKELGIEDFELFVFRYPIFELNTAVKPFAALHLLSRLGYDRVVYLDSDIEVYSSLDSVFSYLENYHLLLTPHLLEPLTDNKRPNNADIARSGKFNMGFFAVKNSHEGIRFLKWWSDRTFNQCEVNPDAEIFVDQKWVDQAPDLFSGVYISPHPGWNVGYWNLLSRDIEKAQNNFIVNREPLIFFHFSGYQPISDEFSTHQNRFTTDNLTSVVQLLVKKHRRNLFKNGLNETVQFDYQYGHFSDGEPIPDILRHIYHALIKTEEPAPKAGKDNFKSELYRYLNQPATLNGQPHALLTHAALGVYHYQADLQNDFDLSKEREIIAFAEWYCASVSRIYRMPDSLIQPIRDKLDNDISSLSPLILLQRFIRSRYNQSVLIRRLVNRCLPKKLIVKIKAIAYR